MDKASHKKPWLFTGASGALGQILVTRALEQQIPIRLLVLAHESKQAKAQWEHQAEIVLGDVRHPESLRQAMQGTQGVLHMAAVILSADPSVFKTVNTQGTAHVLEAMKSQGIARLILVSSISVTYEPRTVYAESKWQAEQLVQQSNLQWTIVRPSLLVGPGGGREYQLFRKLARWPVVGLPRRGQTRKRPIQTKELADHLITLLQKQNQSSIGQIQWAVGSQEMSIAQILQQETRGWRQALSMPWIIPLPVRLCRWVAWIVDILNICSFSIRQAVEGLVQDAAPPKERITI